MSIPGLPPLPSCLKASLSLCPDPGDGNVNDGLQTANGVETQAEPVTRKNRKKSDKSNSSKTKKPKRQQNVPMESHIYRLNAEIDSLRQMDRSLFKQLWSLYENIQEFKQSQDKMSETNSECSSISYSMDNTLETIHDYREHIYVNEKFNSHIYENHHVRNSSLSDSVSSGKEESVYEPVYLKPQCDSPSVPVERRSSISSKLSRNSSNRLSGVITQTTYESSC